MPFRRKPKTKPRKRRAPARGRIQKVIIARPRNTIKSYSSNIGMPLRKFTKLTYFENLVFTPNLSGAHSVYSFHLNSIFDPNATGVGHQPLGLDQLDKFYKQYRVHGARITVQFANGETNVFPMYCGIAVDKSSSLDASLTTKIEATKGTGSRLLLANSNNTKVISQYVSMKKFFSVKNLADDHQLQAVITSDPTLLCYGVIWCQFPSGHPGSTSKAIVVAARIDYNVELFDPIELTGS